MMSYEDGLELDATLVKIRGQISDTQDYIVNSKDKSKLKYLESLYDEFDIIHNKLSKIL